MERLLIRSSAIAGYPELARSVGLDPARIARQAGLHLSSLASPDHQIPTRAAYRLLERSAAANGVADFGLMLAATYLRGLSHLGALGLLARDEPDVRSALPLALPIGRRAGVERVHRSILLLMPTGRCTAHAVAELLGIDRRTMHRHLAEDDTDCDAPTRGPVIRRCRISCAKRGSTRQKWTARG
ncbi:MAG: AraC family transcriptional regulator ligand-binding domain-containing protein [Lautropia sp.]